MDSHVGRCLRDEARIVKMSHSIMKVKDLYSKLSKVISFEFFPPKSEEAEVKLFEVVADLKRLKPSYISVTYGAMGTTRANTLRIVSKIKNEIGIESAAHLTCVGHTRDEICAILLELKNKGIQNIVALRGDAPQGETEYRPHPEGFRFAAEMVAFIRSQSEFADHFSLAVAGYPEGHTECRNLVQDTRHLFDKVNQGADLVITQLFFNNDHYFKFVERCRKFGIKVPIVPGIMPVTHGPQIKKFATMCGATIPYKMEDAIKRYGTDSLAIEEFGIEFATKQCESLLSQGAPGLHFYTLNKSNATKQIYQNLFS